MWGHTDQIYTIYRPEKTAEKVTKNWIWPFLISQLLEISNINIGHKFRYNLQTRIVQFTDQKKKTAKEVIRIQTDPS